MIPREELLALARDAAQRAYCPYSHFHVGAAVAGGGKTYVGVNVEISSYGLTLCAERSALAAAISDGAGAITQVAVACIDTPPDAPLNERSPCGACRQVLAEFNPHAQVIIADANGKRRSYRLNELLPDLFGPDDLPDKA